MKSRMYISSENLKYNVNYIKNKIGNKQIIAMVKANAYGLGSKCVSTQLQKYGINNFGVANIDEAIELRKNGITGMIIVTGVLEANEIDMAIENDISISVSDYDNVVEISNIGKRLNKIVKIHLKIDTGMTRLGFTCNKVLELWNNIIKLENIDIQGIYTHLSCADKDEEYTLEQIEKFTSVAKKLSKNYKFKYIHILNSDGIEKYSNKINIDTHVRAGIMLYGSAGNTKPVTKLTAPIIHINDVKSASKVGYGGTFVAKPNMKIAVVKIGYADGISRCLSNNITVKVNGNICDQVGNICMDLMMIDVTNVKDVKINDEVTIWNYNNDLKQIAQKSNKIVYEVISNIGNRVERIIE